MTGSFAISLIELMIDEEKIGAAPSFLKPKEAKRTAAARIASASFYRLTLYLVRRSPSVLKMEIHHPSRHLVFLLQLILPLQRYPLREVLSLMMVFYEKLFFSYVPLLK